MGELARLAADAYGRNKRHGQTVGILAQSDRAMMIVNGDDGRIIEANDAAYELFGKPLAGANIDRVIPERYRHAHEGHRRIFMERPVVRPMALRDLHAITKDQREIPVQIGLTPIPATRLVIAEIDQVGDSAPAP